MPWACILIKYRAGERYIGKYRAGLRGKKVVGIQLALTSVLDNTVVFVQDANILAACISRSMSHKRRKVICHFTHYLLNPG